MAGYRRKSTILRLHFDDPEYNGLVVKVKSAPIGQLLGLTALAGTDPQNFNPDDLAKVNGMFEVFANRLVEWNLEDESGQPVPATLEGIHSQDGVFVLTIVLTWISAVVGVASPLGPSSSNGQPSPGLSIPMETSSPNLPS